jgi:hypothetical protein
MLVAKYKTKKELKASLGSHLRYQETSIFGPEYPKDGTGYFVVVGPDAYQRNWFAEVTLENHLIVKVK